MLPPTNLSDGSTCDMSTLGSQVLVFNPGTPSGSAINCNSLFSANPSTGEVIIQGRPHVTALDVRGAFDVTGDAHVTGNARFSRIGTGDYAPNAGLPPGWGGGVHTWDVYAEGSVGVGSGGTLAAYMTALYGGYISTNGLGIGGVGPLTSVHATTLMQLSGASCGPYQALTRNGSTGSINCIDITQLLTRDGTVIGTTIMPACAASQVLTSTDGINFSCVTPPTPPRPRLPTCASGEFLTSPDGADFSCATPPRPTPLPVCDDGQILVFVSGSPVCRGQPGSVPLSLQQKMMRGADSWNDTLRAALLAAYGSDADSNYIAAYDLCNMPGDGSDATRLGAITTSQCILYECFGTYNSWAALVTVTGACAKGNTAPTCDNEGGTKMSVSFSCLYPYR